MQDRQMMQWRAAVERYSKRSEVRAEAGQLRARGLFLALDAPGRVDARQHRSVSR